MKFQENKPRWFWPAVILCGIVLSVSAGVVSWLSNPPSSSNTSAGSTDSAAEFSEEDEAPEPAGEEAEEEEGEGEEEGTEEDNGEEEPSASEESEGSSDVWVENEYLLYPVCKDRPLPSGFEPSSSTLVDLSEYEINTLSGNTYRLREDAALALESMLDFAGRRGHEYTVRSAYRSYSTQESTFEYWVQKEMDKGYSRSEAVERAAEYSACPGHSEHQLGTAVDLVLPSLDNEFTQEMWDTEEVEWLEQAAHNYGFVISYPEGKEELTGYRPEPWHLRWIGRDHAPTVWEQGYLDSENEVTPQSYLESLR